MEVLKLCYKYCRIACWLSLLHMTFYLYLLLGFLGGIPAGMGMGGGTVTIPLLVLVGGVEQKIAQCANLFSFLPMSIGALKTHAENKLLKTDGLLWVILPALAISALGATLAAALPSAILRRGFGVFLIGLSFVGFYKEFSEKRSETA
ncbi:MAG: TSUP family transporter [Clostridia bacterium]|nr:TSUP family transporter [Clostridia bacterium]